MVFIVCGGINKGKTGKMLSIYRELGRGDGFISIKKFENDAFVGYDIARLSGGEAIPFIRYAGSTPPNWREAFQYDKFSFSSDAISYAERLTDNFIRENTEPVFIDEIGQIELSGMGFDALFKKALHECRTLYVSVREPFLKDMLSKYNISDYTLINA